MGNFDRTWRFDSILKMDTTVWLSVILAVITFATPALTSEPRVVCYYTNWSVYRPGTARFNPQNINPYLCTHLVYAFGGFTKDNTLKPFDKYQDIEKGGYAKFTGLKTYNKNLKTLLAIGGWNEGSTRFSPMVAARDKRKEFVRNAIKFLRQNRFDGLDLDWEYPAFRDGGKPKDRDNYARLVKELREEFERESEKTGKPRLLLTMAVPAGIEYIQKGFDVKTLNQYLDWMNLLTYDYHSAFEPAVNHHAPLYPLEEPNEYSVDSELNIDYTIKFYLENGADRNKLVLGIPTYGRSYTLFNPDAIEIGSPADGPGEQGDATREKGYLAYYEICEALKPKERKRRLASEEYSDEESEEEEEPWTVMHPNSQAMGPVAFKGNQWVGYDDVDIVKKKAEYVVDNGLGGIMFWSIDNDDFRGNCHGKPYPLIEAAKEAYISKLGTSDNTIVTDKPSSGSKSGGRRRNRPKSTSTTTTTTPKPAKSNKRKSAAASTTPAWNIITPEPPTTPDPGSDFKCVDEGFYPHPRDCKKYFWCLDSGPSNLGIVAHQFTCPSGLFFNKAADSCDFSRNVLCKVATSTTKAPATKTTATSTTTTTTTTRKPIKLSTRNSIQFRTSTTTTTPEPETEEEYEDDIPDDSADIDAEDPRVIKELIDLIKKVGGVEQLEKQLHLSESSASTGGAATTAPALSKKLYQKVLERTRGVNKFGSNSIIQSSSANSRRGPQNAGLEATADKDRLLKKDRPQYTTINRQRPSTTSTTQEPLDSDEIDDEEEEEVKPVLQRSRTQVVESEVSVGTTAKPLQYVNIRRARPTTLATTDTADDTASRNALFERSEQPYLPESETSNSLDIASARRENVPEYVTIRRQRPTTAETTTLQYQISEQELRSQETALEREISTQPQYTSIVRARSTTTPTPEEPSSPEPTTVLAVQISSLLNSPSSAEVESPEPETTSAQTTEAAEPTTVSTTTTTKTPAPTTTASSLPTRRKNIILRRRGSTTTTTTATPTVSSSTQAAKRNFLRRTKATAPPDTTESDTVTIDNVDTTTNKFTRRGGSKFKNRKDVAKEAANDTGRVEKNEFENRTRRPYLSGGPRRSERPALTPPRTFARRKPGGANVTTATPQLSSTVSPPSRRPFRVASRRRPIIGSTTTTTTTTTSTTEATTAAIESEESLQEIGDTDFIEDPSLEPRTPKTSPKIQRRPLVTLKEDVKDQNPSATNEEEGKRQSKKYSASIKQNQLDDLLRLKAKSQEETTEYRTTVEEYSAETALAIAAHQLLTAPVPSIPDFEEETRPTRTQTTQEYKYTSPVTDYADSKFPYEYPSTTVYKPSTEQNYISTTANEFDDLTQFNSPKFSTTTNELTELDSPKLSRTTYDITQFNSQLPRTTYDSTQFNSLILSTATYETTEFNSPKLPTTTSEPTEFKSPKFSRTTYDSTQSNSTKLYTTTYEPTELNSPKLASTTYEPTEFKSPKFSRTTYGSTQSNSPKLFTTTYEPTDFNSPKILTTTYEPTELKYPKFYRTTYDSTNSNSPKLFTTTNEPTEFNTPKLPTTTYKSIEFNSPKLSRTNYDSAQFNRRSSPTPFTPKTTYDSVITDTETPTETSTPPTPTINKLSFGNELTFSTPEYPTVNEYTDIPIEYNSVTPSPAGPSPKSSVSKKSRFPDFTYDNDYIRTTDYAPRISSTGLSEPSPFSREPVSSTDYTNLPTDYLPKLSPTTNFARNPPSTFKTRQRFSTANIITSGLSGVSKNVGSRYQTSEKYIPVPVEGLEYSTIGFSSSTQEPISRSQEPSYFTREYLLESPVTKTYDDEYQYLAPITTPKTPPRRIIRKKIQRKISTTVRPTTTFRPRLTTAYIPLTTPYIAPVTTPKPRRVPSKKPFEKILKEDPPRTYRPIVNYDYYDDSEEKVAEKYVEGTKVVLHTKGAIECLDIGNFPHPTSCKKFISCARMESGALLGWEYICPKGLSFDPVGSICNWSAGLGCDEKDI